MKRFFLIIALITVTSLFSQARTVRLDDYGTPDDNQDDSSAFQQAVDDLSGSGGGTLVVSEGTWDVKNTINLVNPATNITSVRISGNKGAILMLALNEEKTFLYIGNGVQVELFGLIMLPKNMNPVFDAGYILTAAYTGQTMIQNCAFLGLMVKYDLIKISNTDLIVEKSIFGGNAAGGAQIHGVDFSGLTVRDTVFLDYYQYHDTYYSKTPHNGGMWIKAENTTMPAVNAMTTKAVTISNSRFDEGAPVAIYAKNTPFVDITDVNINVAGIASGIGIYLDNVKYAQIKLSGFGYSPAERPAVKAVNNSTVEVVGLRFGNGVFFAEIERNTKLYMEKCLECAAPDFVRIISAPAAAAGPTVESETNKKKTRLLK
jgi:hypothetical protein